MPLFTFANSRHLLDTYSSSWYNPCDVVHFSDVSGSTEQRAMWAKDCEFGYMSLKWQPNQQYSFGSCVPETKVVERIFVVFCTEVGKSGSPSTAAR